MQLLVEKGYDPLAYRYLCLTAHYRSQLNFSWEALDAAQTALNRLRAQVHALGPAGEPDAGYVDRHRAEVSDDLNFPKALALAWEVLRTDLPDSTKRATVLAFDDVFGLGLAEWMPRIDAVPRDIAALAAARWDAKKARNWPEADRLRTQIRAAGFEIEDESGSYRVKRRSI